MNKLRIWTVLLGLSFKSAWSAEIEAFTEFTIDGARDYLRIIALRIQEENKAHVEPLFMRARLESQLGQQDEAERFARRALEEDPARADIESFLGDLYIRQARLEDAATSLRKALDFEPKLEGGYRRLGMVLDRLGNHKEAREVFQTGVQAVPEDGTMRLLLGRLQLNHSEVQDAVVHLQKACIIDPNSPNAFYALSQAQARMGDREAARETLKVFQRLKRKEGQVLDAKNVAHDNEKTMRVLASGFHTEVAEWLLQQRQEAIAEAHLRCAHQ